MYDMTTLARKLDAADKTPMTLTERMLINEIRRLRAQVEQLTTDAIIRADRQAILIDALKDIEKLSNERMIRHIASVAITDIGELR